MRERLAMFMLIIFAVFIIVMFAAKNAAAIASVV